jgi:RNA polymerase sigma-70 factor (ECF subfamily)
VVDDDALWKAARAGDDAMFEQLVRRYERPLFGFIACYVHDQARAEDLFQETFLRVYSRRTAFSQGAAFKPWIYQVARNLCRDEARRRAAGPDVDSSVPQIEIPNGHAQDPGEAAGSAEAACAVRKALDALRPDDREVVMLRVFQGMSFEEIARVTGDSAGTLRSRLFHALGKLRPRLETVAKEQGFAGG